MAECKIETCYAITCRHNKQNKCTLEKVMVNEEAKCNSFERDMRSPRRKNKIQVGTSTPSWAVPIQRRDK